MPSKSTALSAARSSRGYLFTVVACSVLLTAQAAIQWVRDAGAVEPVAAGEDGPPPEADPQPGELEQALRDAKDRLAAADSAISATALRQATAAAVLDELNVAAERLHGEIPRLEMEVAYARRARDEAAAAASQEVVEPVEQENEETTAVEASLAELQSQLTELLTRFTRSHPVVQDVERRIAEVSAQLQKLRATTPRVNGTNDDGPLRAAEAALLAAEEKLSAAHNELAELNATRDEKSIALADLQKETQRQEEEKEEAKTELVRLEKLRQRAEKPRPTVDDPQQVEAFGLLFSLAIGCLLGCVAYVRAKPVNQKITSRADVESILALPLIGLLPGTDSFPVPPPEPDLPRATRVRLIAELTLATFIAANAAAVALVDGHAQRLTGQPLSAFADGVRVVVEQVIA